MSNKHVPLDADTQGHYIEVCHCYSDLKMREMKAAQEAGLVQEALDAEKQMREADRVGEKACEGFLTMDDIDKIDKWEELLVEVHG